MFDQKHIYASPALILTLTLNSNPNTTLTLKRNYVLGLTKWHHFSIKYNDTFLFLSCWSSNAQLNYTDGSSKLKIWNAMIFINCIISYFKTFNYQCIYATQIPTTLQLHKYTIFKFQLEPEQEFTNKFRYILRK